MIEQSLTDWMRDTISRIIDDEPIRKHNCIENLLKEWYSSKNVALRKEHPELDKYMHALTQCLNS